MLQGTGVDEKQSSADIHTSDTAKSTMIITTDYLLEFLAIQPVRRGGKATAILRAGLMQTLTGL